MSVADDDDDEGGGCADAAMAAIALMAAKNELDGSACWDVEAPNGLNWLASIEKALLDELVELVEFVNEAK